MATDGKQIVLITGANTGLGLAAVKSMYSSSTPHHIIMAGRSAEKVSTAIAELQTEGPSPSGSTVEGLTLDITSDTAVAAAAEKVVAAHGRLDALVNNAGGAFDPEWLAGNMSRRESLNRTFDLNVSSVHAVTEAFVPLLAKSPNPRLLVVTSGMASLQEESTKTTPAENRIKPPVAGFPKPVAAWGMAGYRVSKTALNMLFLIWVRILAADNIRCFDVSPGFLATGLANSDPEVLKKAGALDPRVGGDLIRDIVAGKRDDDAGLVIRKDSVQPW